MDNSIKKGICSNDLLSRSLAYLVLNCSFIPDLGLFHGRIGYVILFAHYGRDLNNSIYEDFAGKLLDEVCSGLNKEYSISLESGLCGIGWGIEYLVQNRFMEGDTDEILKEIDNRIMEYDLRRMKDLSLRRGIGGILIYIVARLSSPRNNRKMPFDKCYLKEIQDIVLQLDFSKEDELPNTLLSDLIHLIDGDEVEVVTINYLFSSLKIDKEFFASFDDSLFINGLEYSWMYLNRFSDLDIIDIDNIVCGKKKNFYLISNETRSSNYGIGTYIYQVIKALGNLDWNLNIITLCSSKTSTLLVENIDNIRYIYIGNTLSIKSDVNGQLYWKLYAENVLVLLQSVISKTNISVFMLNHLHFADLVNELRRYYAEAKIFATVHYMDWSFSLWGNREKLRDILAHPDKIENKTLCEGFYECKRFLNACDKVIAIARHSYNVLLEECEIPEDKIFLIPHGIKDEMYLNNSKDLLRKKYGFKNDEFLIIFAGRLDQIKGVDLLASAFRYLCLKYDSLRLLIAGEGSYELMQKQLLFYNTKVSFLGFVDKRNLYELFYISNIGVVPSLYEDFGYVAIEMMMNELPLVVGNNSGLAEIVEDGVTGLVVPFKQDVKFEEDNVIALRNCLEKLIQDSFILRSMSEKGRERFLMHYDISCFKDKFVSSICYDI